MLQTKRLKLLPFNISIYQVVNNMVLKQKNKHASQSMLVFIFIIVKNQEARRKIGGKGVKMKKC